MRRFILGVGTQKAGTTWIYRQLSGSKNFKKPGKKELHILDATYLRDELPRRQKLFEEIAQRILRKPKNFEQSFASKKLHMLYDVDQYFHYFDSLIGDGEFSCDLTPEYCGLPIEAFELINKRFSDIGIEVKVVFLVREPVCRLESAIRMNIRNTQGFDGVTPEHIMKRMQNQSNSKGDKIRSNYQSTYEKIISSFGPEKCFVGVFETMFSDQEQERMSKFIGIPRAELKPDEPENMTTNRFLYESSVLDDLRDGYAKQYDFVQRELGLDRKVWDEALDRMRL